MGAAGLVAAAWPLIDQLNPDAALRASGDVVETDLASQCIPSSRGRNRVISGT
jgi:Rieske Fe-S protein